MKQNNHKKRRKTTTTKLKINGLAPHLDRFEAVQLDVGSDVISVALGGPVGGGGGQQMSVVGLHVDGVRVLLAVFLQRAVHLVAVACRNIHGAAQFLLA